MATISEIILMRLRRHLVYIFGLAFFIFLFFGAIRPAVASAASLYLSPSSGSHAVGETFSVGVYVSSLDQAMNAASGEISFPKDKLESIAPLRDDSIISSWVQEPNFSNSDGILRFEGIIFNPGFTGSAGKIIAARFRVKAPGSASLTFSSGSVLANDGKGTEILNQLGQAQYTLSVASVAPTSPPAVSSPSAGTPAAPKITSSTHPDSNSWYTDRTAQFSWPLSSEITGTRLLIGRLSSVTPTVVYVPPLSSKTLTNLEDGTWYFHAQLRNAKGWGGVTHFRLQIDGEKPESFVITEIEREDLTDPRAQFKFEAKDATSGIGVYKIRIDEGDLQEWRDDGKHTYEAPALGPGRHNLYVQVFDKAGNYLESSIEFTIQALEQPRITDYPETFQPGEPFVVRGSTYPDSIVTMQLTSDKGEIFTHQAKSDNNGDFVLTYDKELADGLYTLELFVEDARGARSEATPKLTIRSGLWVVGIFNKTVTFVSNLFGKLFNMLRGLVAPTVASTARLVLTIAAIIILLALLAWAFFKEKIQSLAIRKMIKEKLIASDESKKYEALRAKLGKEIGAMEKAKYEALAKILTKEVEEAYGITRQAFELLKKDLKKQLTRLRHVESNRDLTFEEKEIATILENHLDLAEKFIKKEIDDVKKKLNP